MGPLSYMRSVVDRNVVMRRMTLVGSRNSVSPPKNLRSLYFLFQHRAILVSHCSGHDETVQQVTRIIIITQWPSGDRSGESKHPAFIGHFISRI